MSGTLTALPGDAIITVTYPTSYARSVAEILAGPASRTGIWDGPDTPDPTPQMTWSAICFRLNVLQGAGSGCAWEDICKDAAVIAGHLAELLTPHWPGSEAHVRAWPLIDLNMQFIAAPGVIPATPTRTVDQIAADYAAFVENSRPDLAAQLRDMFKPGCDCGCECCG